VIDKKLAERLKANPRLMASVKKALAAGEPLWTCGVMQDEQDVRDTIAAMEAK
jgi:hypothetical protein